MERGLAALLRWRAASLANPECEFRRGVPQRHAGCRTGSLGKRRASGRRAVASLDVTIISNLGGYMHGTNSMHFERRPGALSLVAGKLALDFVNTESGRGGLEHLDHLQTAADLVAWAAHAEVIGARDAALAQRLIKDQSKLARYLIA